VPVFLAAKGLAALVQRRSLGDSSAVYRHKLALLVLQEPYRDASLRKLEMDVIGYLASALGGLPAILGIAREYLAALVVAAVALTRWMAAVVMAVAVATLGSSGAHAQTLIPEGAAALVYPGPCRRRSSKEVQEREPEGSVALSRSRRTKSGSCRTQRTARL
jgi:hypothetical protein